MESLLNIPIGELLSLKQQNTTQTIHQKIKEAVEGEDKVFEWEIQTGNLTKPWIEVSC